VFLGNLMCIIVKKTQQFTTPFRTASANSEI